MKKIKFIQYRKLKNIEIDFADNINMGTIYQFTLDTRYSIFENIKKGDFQTETVF